MSAPLLDTNVLLRHIVADVPEQASRATALLARIEQGELSACLAHTVVFETVYTLQRFYRVPRPAIRDAVLPVIELPGIVLPGKTSYRQIFDWYVAFPALSFPIATTPCWRGASSYPPLSRSIGDTIGSPASRASSRDPPLRRRATDGSCRGRARRGGRRR